MTEALAGIRVLDLTIWQQGPMTTALLADWGADVIKVEGPGSPDPGRSLVRYEAAPGGANAYFETHNRNKRAIVLDLKADAGRDVFYRLVRDADVVVLNYRVGVPERLGVDYETLRALNPRLVYCQASGFGLKGPDAQRPALDPLAQARGGLMSVTGEPDSPPTRTFTGMADQTSAFLLALGVMVALFHRERTEEGQMVDGSLLQSMLGVQSFNIGSYMMSGTYAGSPIPRLPRGLTSPLWNHYRAKDGRWLMIAMSQLGRHWRPFCKVMEEATGDHIEPEELTLDWIRGNATEVVSLVKRIDGLFARHTAAYWLDLFRRNDMLVEIAQDYSEIPADPQVVANEMLTSIPHDVFGELKFVATPVNLSATPGTIRTPAPDFGQHTEEVLLEAGYSWEEIGVLRESGTIGHG